MTLLPRSLIHPLLILYVIIETTLCISYQRRASVVRLKFIRIFLNTISSNYINFGEQRYCYYYYLLSTIMIFHRLPRFILLMKFLNYKNGELKQHCHFQKLWIISVINNKLFCKFILSIMYLFWNFLKVL